MNLARSATNFFTFERAERNLETVLCVLGGENPKDRTNLRSQQSGQGEDDGPLSINATIGRLLADEKAKAILEKRQPDLTSHLQIGQAMDMSLKQAAAYSQDQVTDETLEAINEDLSKL